MATPWSRLTTSTIPGSFFSSAAFEDCGPLPRTGGRTNVAYAIPGTRASMPYLAAPVVLAGTSTRGMPLPSSRYSPGFFRSLVASSADGVAGGVAKDAISP